MANSPNLRLIEPARLSPEPRSVALIGNFPPRRCGIATFTADVFDALASARPDLVCDVYAMTDEGQAYDYPQPVRMQVRQNAVDDYLAAAARISRTRPDVILVQHEFGIFGGPAGEHLMLMLEAVDRPVVSTLHTVLENPDEDQRRVFHRLLARSSQLMVMAERGRTILREVWGVADEKIAVIPHGAPDRPLASPDAAKAALGFVGRDLLLTFGLLSPNKGIETMVRALPRIVEARPEALYLVLGATHPHLVAHEGERYRASLLALAENLGVGDHLRLVDDYTDIPLLLDYLEAADVYVTPYLNAAQITSGTLSYAAALGKPIVSTPYWHAEELLADGRGRLAAFGDSDAFAGEVVQLLQDPAGRQALRERIYDATRHTVWASFAESLIAALAAARPVRQEGHAAVRPASPPRPAAAALRRLTDSCGMIQHSVFDIPDRSHGYCVDDNARALVLTHRLPGTPDTERRALTSIFAAFVQHAWNDETGRFRNFMAYDRSWLEAAGSEDSTGRAFQSVATTIAEAADPALRRWAQSLMGRILPRMETVRSPRASGSILVGMATLIEAGWAEGRLRALAAERLGDLVRMYAERADRGEPWFEPVLSYDNARLPEAVIRGGLALNDQAAVRTGLRALEWLCEHQTAPRGQFLPTATADFGQPLDARSMFDQQPLESCAMVEACEAAFAATEDLRWLGEAQRAYAWYEGANSQGVALVDADGGCFDGITWSGVNENKGAESVLSYQAAACAMLRLTAAARGSVKTVVDF